MFIQHIRPWNAHPTWVTDRQTPQVTPQSAKLPCKNKMVTWTSGESMAQDQLTPYILHQTQKQNKCVGAGVTVHAEHRPALSPVDLHGVWVDGGRILWERPLAMKYMSWAAVIAPPQCTSSLPRPFFQGMQPWSQSARHQVINHSSSLWGDRLAPGKHIEEKIYSRKGHGVRFFLPVSSTVCTTHVVNVLHVSVQSGKTHE